MQEDVENGYIFKLDDLRGKVRGFQNEAKRKLETALDASTANPPCMAVVIERLQDALQMISNFNVEHYSPNQAAK